MKRIRLPLSLTVQSVISRGDVVIARTFNSQTAEVFETSAVSSGAGGIITITAQLSDSVGAGLITNTAFITATKDDDHDNNEAAVGLTINTLSWTVKARDMVGNVSSGLTATFTISATSSIYLPIVVKDN